MFRGFSSAYKQIRVLMADEPFDAVASWNTRKLS